MKEYLVYTNEGFTEDPKGNPISNCQIVDFIMAKDLDECVKTIKEEANNGKYQNFNIEDFEIVEIKRKQ